MRLIGLTGGIAMGKSTVARLLSERGLAVVDTDDLAREVVEPGQLALDDIRREFGPDLLDPSGRLRRPELARLVFAEPEARKRLEAILHPRIRDRWRREVEEWRAAGRPAGAVVIPLLFEIDAAAQFDVTICVACTEPTQQGRFRSRGWTTAEAAARVRAQWSVERKMAASTFVLWTEGELSVTAAQVARILRQLNLHLSF